MFNLLDYNNQICNPLGHNYQTGNCYSTTSAGFFTRKLAEDILQTRNLPVDLAHDDAHQK